jgi:plastocyanin
MTTDLAKRMGPSYSERQRPSGWRRPLVLIGFVIISAGTVGCSSSPASAPASAPTTAPGPAAVAPGATAQIAISNFAFIPVALTVHPGTKVTVVNRDSVAHTVTSSSGGFTTGDIPAGQSATFTAPGHSGDYSYICTIHPNMMGKLTVS